MKKYFIFFALFLLCLGLSAISFLIHHKKLDSFANSVERIKHAGTLRLIISKSFNTYYIYEGRPMGFEYDLAKAFADHLGVDLKIVTPGWSNMLTFLDQGKGDLVAAGLAATPERRERFDFSTPYMTIQQQVIHHNLKFGPKNIEDLASRTFHVRRGSSHHSRLEQLKASGIALEYVLHPNTSTEELVAMVNDRKIKFTIANSDIAILTQRYYTDIRIGIPVQEKEPLAWAVRKTDPELLKEINGFLRGAEENGLLQKLMDKYHANIRDFDVYELKQFHKRVKSRLPKYEKIIKQESLKYGFDWRLVAAVIYQESHFDPKARSFTNVGGLMQVTTATAKEMGIKNRLNPTQSIKAGIKYLDKMHKKFSHMSDEYQRMLFALASYNVGYGHVLDAIRIAKEKKLDIQTWQALKTCLPLLSKSEYYKKTKYGYARGWEPVHYVERVLTYFDILKQKEIS